MPEAMSPNPTTAKYTTKTFLLRESLAAIYIITKSKEKNDVLEPAKKTPITHRKDRNL